MGGCRSELGRTWHKSTDNQEDTKEELINVDEIHKSRNIEKNHNSCFYCPSDSAKSGFRRAHFQPFS